MSMSFIRRFGTALVLGAVLFSPLSARGGSCCGGGGGTALLLPSYYRGMIDVSVDMEKYNGLWNNRGEYIAQPEYHLWQYRLNLGFAQRLASRWQTSITVPYVWNYNGYPNSTSRSDGVGDITLNLWYEAVDDKSAWKIRNLKDMVPSVTIGIDLLVPTGISPYDDVKSSYDITGRGFYRFDGNLQISKTVNPWNASLLLSYGTYLERPVNREVGIGYVEPYRKKLGDRTSASISVGYTFYLGTGGDKLTGTGSFAYLAEGDTTYNSVPLSNSGFRKESFGAALAYASTDHDWSARLSWSHAVRQDGWGDNFPTTDIYTVGVSYGFR
jgi:hypothetical protein